MTPELVAIDMTAALKKHGITQFIVVVVFEGDRGKGHVGIFQSEYTSTGLREITDLLCTHIAPQSDSKTELEIFLKNTNGKQQR